MAPSTSKTNSQTDYYPFGLTFYDGASQGTSTLTQNRYLYNGKELQDDFGLDWYDYGWRFYDPVLGRWQVIDPAAELYYAWGGYVYVGDNPIKRVDPDGQVWNVVGGAILGGAVEAGIQIDVSMARGQDFMSAVQNLDLQDVGIAMFEGGMTSGGSIAKNIAKKGITMAITETTKASVDVTMAEGTKSIGGIVGEEKDAGDVALDLAFGVAGAKSTDAVITSSKNAAKSDITSGTYATLTKSEKSTAQTVDNIVNSQEYEKVIGAASSAVGGPVKSEITSSGSSSGLTEGVATFNLESLYQSTIILKDKTTVNINHLMIE